MENVFDVLCVADMYLLTGLKRLCGKTLAKAICEDNILHMWKTAKLFRLSRLEDQCAEFMAKIIERVSMCSIWGGSFYFGWKAGNLQLVTEVHKNIKHMLSLLCMTVR